MDLQYFKFLSSTVNEGGPELPCMAGSYNNNDNNNNDDDDYYYYYYCCFYHYCSNQDEFPFLKEVIKLPKSPKDWNLANLYVHSELS